MTIRDLRSNEKRANVTSDFARLDVPYAKQRLSSFSRFDATSMETRRRWLCKDLLPRQVSAAASSQLRVPYRLLIGRVKQTHDVNPFVNTGCAGNLPITNGESVNNRRHAMIVSFYTFSFYTRVGLPTRALLIA